MHLNMEPRTMTTNKFLTYEELITIDSLEGRIKYLELHDFNYGSPREINSRLYKSSLWMRIRKEIILRDGGNDLGMTGVPITGRALIHHINPITVSDIENWNEDKLINPSNLVLCSYKTHGRIHFSMKNQEPELTERSPRDTLLW